MPSQTQASRYVLSAILLLAVGCALTVKPIYAADELPKESVLPLSMASKAVQAAVEACKKDGYRVSESRATASRWPSCAR